MGESLREELAGPGLFAVTGSGDMRPRLLRAALAGLPGGRESRVPGLVVVAAGAVDGVVRPGAAVQHAAGAGLGPGRTGVQDALGAVAPADPDDGHEEDGRRDAGQVSDCRDHQESHHAALPLSQRREFTVNAITSFPYSGTSWKRHYDGGQGRANISVRYTSEIKRESAGKAAGDILVGRGRVPCGPAGTPAGRRLLSL